MSEPKRPSVAGSDGRFEPIPDSLATQLPEKPSVGELIEEIDRARHEAARTAGALADKLNVRSRIGDAAHDRLETLPPWLNRMVGVLRENPRTVLAAIVALLVLRAVLRRVRRGTS